MKRKVTKCRVRLRITCPVLSLVAIILAPCLRCVQRSEGKKKEWKEKPIICPGPVRRGYAEYRCEDVILSARFDLDGA